MENLLNKGDVIKTGVSDHTLVLKVKNNDAILFTGSQFIVSHGIQKEGDKVFWNWGEYYDELPDGIFERGVQEKLPHEDLEQGKGFSYERFCEYVRNKMSTIYQNKEGQYGILGDTQALQEITPDELGWLTEEETLRYIFDNNLFGEMEEIIEKNPAYIYDSKVFENISENLKNIGTNSEINSELEDDWELEP